MRIVLRQAAALDRDDFGHWRTREHVTSLRYLVVSFSLLAIHLRAARARGQSAAREIFGRLTAVGRHTGKQTHQPIRCTKSPSPE